MRLDGSLRIFTDRDGRVESSDSDEFSSSEERSDSEECSDLEEHSNSETPSDPARPRNPLLRLEAAKDYLELSIHEIFHYRLGPALWTYHRDSDKPGLDDLLMPLRSPTDILGNTFDKNCIGQMKLLAMIHGAGLFEFYMVWNGQELGLS